MSKYFLPLGEKLENSFFLCSQATSKKLLNSFSQDLDFNPDVVLPEIKDRINQCLKWINPVLGEEINEPQDEKLTPVAKNPIPGKKPTQFTLGI